VTYLKHMLAEKEKMIGELNKQAQTKHEQYQEKLHKFKEMQD